MEVGKISYRILISMLHGYTLHLPTGANLSESSSLVTMSSYAGYMVSLDQVVSKLNSTRSQKMKIAHVWYFLFA